MTNLATMEDVKLPTRLPYHPAIQRDFGVDRATWKALTEAIYPAAKTQEGVLLALTYCRARNLDIMKRPVHVVPIWNSALGREVESVWPGIGEIRTTAHRTGLYAGRDATAFGPDLEGEWEYQGKRDRKPRKIRVSFPEWAQVTVHRLVDGEVRSFAGPKVYWLETYATIGKSDAPNSMWERRPRGQLDKCAEAAALRAAFPEEIGEQYTSDEVGSLRGVDDMIPAVAVEEKPSPSSAESLREKAKSAMNARVAPEPAEEDEPGAEGEEPAEQTEEVGEFSTLTKAGVKDIRAYAKEQGVSVDELEGLLGEPLADATFPAKDPASAESMVRKMIDDLAAEG